MLDRQSRLLLAGMFLWVPGSVAIQGTSPGTRPTDPAVRIAAYLSRLEQYGFSGVVLVARRGEIIVHSAHGLADQRRKIPMRRDHIFDMGSLTKQFTAAGIVALEEEGKLRVTDSIGKYFANVPRDKAGITIHHLLTHTSGLPMGFGGDYERVTRDDIVTRSLGAELQSPPGERHAYSNAGYSLLGAIIELVSGQPLEAFMRDRFFRRAGMMLSGYFPPDTQRVARAYREGKDLRLIERTAEAGGEVWNLIGNGGLHSTLADMYRWMLALQHDRLFTRATRDKLLRPYALHSSNYRGQGSLHYAYGWYVWKLPNGKTVIWHLGGNGALNTATRWHVEDSTLVLYASNTSEFHDPAYPVPVIERILAGDSVTMPPPVSRVAPTTLARYAGRYRAEDATLVVETHDGFLRLRGEGQRAFWFATRGEWVSDTALAGLNVRTATVVEQSRTQRWAELRTAFGSQTTVQGLADFESTFWRKRHTAHGDYVRTRVIGTEPAGSRYAGRSLVAIDFARGSTFREYFWTRDGIIGDLGPLDDTPVSRQYFPISISCFGAVVPQSGKTSRVCFEGARADEMVVTGVSGAPAVRIRRER
jgi:CubicO group peptidase (beta-lactamase class C family)